MVSTAMKNGDVDPTVAAAAVSSMLMLNADAAAAALAAGATGATDVTGFGLLGHLAKMAEHSSVDVDLVVDQIPVLPGAIDLARSGVVPGGTRRNLEWARERVDAGSADGVTLLVLADAQTSGGLLFGVAPDQANSVVDQLRSEGHRAAAIGAARRGSGRIRLDGT
jgi:selenide,water dikinase